MSPQGRLLQSIGSNVCSRLGCSVPGISSWLLSGAIGIAGGVFVVIGCISCEMVGALVAVAIVAAFVVMVCKGKNPKEFVVVGVIGNGWVDV